MNEARIDNRGPGGQRLPASLFDNGVSRLLQTIVRYSRITGQQAPERPGVTRGA